MKRKILNVMPECYVDTNLIEYLSGWSSKSSTLLLKGSGPVEQYICRQVRYRNYR